MTQLGDPDSGETSICSDPAYAPIQYWWYPHHAGDTRKGTLRALLASAGLSTGDSERFMGEIQATMNMLEAGKLLPLHNVKGPMRNETRIRLFELRFSYLYRTDDARDHELHVRFYHVEPKDFAKKGSRSMVVGLHAHAKDIQSDTVFDEQDSEIAIASDRYFEGVPTRWGLLNQPRST